MKEVRDGLLKPSDGSDLRRKALQKVKDLPHRVFDGAISARYPDKDIRESLLAFMEEKCPLNPKQFFMDTGYHS